jgi:predicted RNA-binding protein YlxR (DUF448 family)
MTVERVGCMVMNRVTPVRTCVGCREKAAKSDLLRVVVDATGPTRSVVVDERGSRAGRGAHLHATSTCLDLADRRRAFPRAFRLPGPLDTTAVRAWLETHRPASPDAVSPDISRKRSSGS